MDITNQWQHKYQHAEPNEPVAILYTKSQPNFTSCRPINERSSNILMSIIKSDDDFEIKSKIYSFNLRLVLKHILHSRNLIFGRLIRVKTVKLHLPRANMVRNWFTLLFRFSVALFSLRYPNNEKTFTNSLTMHEPQTKENQ